MENLDIQQKLQKYFSSKDEVQIAILFGSFAKGTFRSDSDVDVALALEKPLSLQEKVAFIEELSLVVNRPIDLIDLQTAHAPLSQEILAKGIILKKTNSALFEKLVKNMLYEVADFLPLKRKEQIRRIKKFIGSEK